MYVYVCVCVCACVRVCVNRNDGNKKYQIQQGIEDKYVHIINIIPEMLLIQFFKPTLQSLSIKLEE